MVDVLRKLVPMEFDEAVEHVEKIIVEEGFSILLTKSIDEIMKKKLGLEDYPVILLSLLVRLNSPRWLLMCQKI